MIDDPHGQLKCIPAFRAGVIDFRGARQSQIPERIGSIVAQNFFDVKPRQPKLIPRRHFAHDCRPVIRDGRQQGTQFINGGEQWGGERRFQDICG